MKESACNQDILNLLAGKASTKQLVFRQTKDVFKEFKALLKTIADELNSNICKIDKKVVVEYFDNGELEAEIRFSGDALIFHMHTNTFTFDKSHFTNQHSYIKKEPLNGYFGLISMYNFLADSLRYNRPNDVGHLLGRLFINREKHFFVDGKRQFAFMYNNPAEDIATEVTLRGIIEKTIIIHSRTGIFRNNSMYNVMTLATSQFFDNRITPITTPITVAVTHPINARTSVLSKPIKPARKCVSRDV